jgi:hypothetical protein
MLIPEGAAMRVTASVLVLCFSVVSATVAEAQHPYPDEPPRGPARLDISGSGGWLLPTDWSDLVLLGSVSPITGALEQVLVRDLVVDPGPVYDGIVTYWRGRYGFRVHGAYAKSCLAVGRSCGDFATMTPDSGPVDVKSYTYDVGGAIGLLDFKPARWVWPFVFFGFGGVTYDLDRTVGPPLTFIEQLPPAGTPPAIITDTPDPLIIAVDELGVETRFAFNIGFGSDFRIPLGAAALGVRFEVGDYMHDSPIDLDVTALNRFRRSDEANDFGFGVVHNLRASIGIVLHFGR